MSSKLLKPDRATNTTDWPLSLPRPDESKFLSVAVSEDSEIVWSIHEVENELGVFTYKSKLELDKDKLSGSNKYEKLELLRANIRNVRNENPKYGINDLHDFICPNTSEANEEDATPTADITIYIVSANARDEKLLLSLFRCIPSRVFVMKSTDFFLQSERENLRVKVDRVAALRGAAHIHGFPAILFDVGDEQITCTTAGWDGRLLGESVFCGLWQRLRCLSGSNSDLRVLTEDTVEEVTKDVTENKRPMPIITNNVVRSAIANTMTEVSNHARYIHKVWLEKVGPPESENSEGQDRHMFNFCKENYGRTGSVTGKKRNLLVQLLKENHGGLLECPKLRNQRANHVNEGNIGKIPLIFIEPLISYGIHNTILRMKNILSEKGESIFKEFLDSTKKDYAKKRPTNFSSEKILDKATSEKASTSKKRKKPEEIMEKKSTKKLKSKNKKEKKSKKKSKEDSAEKKGLKRTGHNKEGSHKETRKDLKKKSKSKGKRNSSKIRETEPLVRKEGSQEIIDIDCTESNEGDSISENMIREAEPLVRKEGSQEVIVIDSLEMKEADFISKNKCKFENKEGITKERNIEPTKKKPNYKKELRVYSETVTKNPLQFINKKISKKFDDKTFEGTIESYEKVDGVPVWHVKYVDGDSEDFNVDELYKTFRFHSRTKNVAFLSVLGENLVS